MPNKYHDYESASGDDEHSLLEGHPVVISTTSYQRKAAYLVLFALGCGSVGFISTFLGATAAARWFTAADAATCTDLVAHKSPVTQDLPISYHMVTFEGSFLNENIYRQKGSPEVDAAWEALGTDFIPMAIPADRAQRAGIAKDQVHIADKYGGGYPANLEGLHHLHCLNLVRKSLYFNYDYYRNLGEGAFINSDHIVRKHVTHCLDIVRQQLMCTVDIGVLGQVWWRNDTMSDAKPFVDFNTQHVCRNYDDIRDWAKARQLEKEWPSDFLVQPKEGDTVYDSIP